MADAAGTPDNRNAGTNNVRRQQAEDSMQQIQPYVAMSKRIDLHSFDAFQLQNGEYEWYEPQGLARKQNFETDFLRIHLEHFRFRNVAYNWINSQNQDIRIGLYRRDGQNPPELRTTTLEFPKGTYGFENRDQMIRPMEYSLQRAIEELLTSYGDNVSVTVSNVQIPSPETGTYEFDVIPANTLFAANLSDYRAIQRNDILRSGQTGRAWMQIQLDKSNIASDIRYSLQLGENSETTSADTIWGINPVNLPDPGPNRPPPSNKIVGTAGQQAAVQVLAEENTNTDFIWEALTPKRIMPFSDSSVYLRMSDNHSENLESQYLSNGIRSFDTIGGTPGFLSNMTNSDILLVAPLKREFLSFEATNDSTATSQSGYFFISSHDILRRIRLRVTNENNESISNPDLEPFTVGPVPFEVGLRIDVVRHPFQERIAGAPVSQRSEVTPSEAHPRKRVKTTFEGNLLPYHQGY